VADHRAGTTPLRPLAGHLGELDTVGRAIRLVHEAVDAGVTCFDNELASPRGSTTWTTTITATGQLFALLALFLPPSGGASGAQPPS
jgi:hypothetical protein